MNKEFKYDISKGYDTNPYVSVYVDMYPLRNIYMTSSGLGNLNTIGVSRDKRC